MQQEKNFGLGVECPSSLWHLNTNRNVMKDSSKCSQY